MPRRISQHPQRDRHDIIHDILQLVSNTQPIYRSQRHQTSIGYAANLTHPQTVKYLKQLVEEGLLVLIDSKPFQFYEITDKGRRCLQIYNELQEDMQPASPDLA
jgi:predicted transcriptional regulator